MSRKSIPHVTCDTCFVEEPMSDRDQMPDEWGTLEDGLTQRDICPSCKFEILGHMFRKERTDVIVLRHGAGHPEEQKRYAEHVAKEGTRHG